MAISTFGDLKTALVDWAVIPNAPLDILISEAEAKLKPIVKHYRSIKDVYIDIPENRTITLPDDVLELKFVSIGGRETKELSLFGGNINETEAAYERVGKDVKVYGHGELKKFRVVYWSKCVDLSNINNTNWLLTYFPNVYLHASLVELYDWSKNAEDSAYAEQKLQQSLALLAEDDRKWTLSGTSYSFA